MDRRGPALGTGIFSVLVRDSGYYHELKTQKSCEM